MRSLTLLSTAAILAGTRTATGQEIRWNNPLGGSWNLETNWQTGEIPDSFSEMAIIDAPGAYTVEFDRSTMLRRFLVQNPEARVNMNAGDSLYMSTHVGNASGVILTVNGVLTVNSTGENRLTEISVCDFETYDERGLRAEGTGTIRLNAHPDNLDSAQITGFCSVMGMHIGPDQTISGTGKIRARMWNDGAIVADVPGRVLELNLANYYGVSHEGELRAENGGVLRLIGTVRSDRDQPRGRVVVADADSSIEFSTAYLFDVLIDNSNDGECVWGTTCQWTSVQLSGTHRIRGGTHVSVVSELINDGLLIVRSDNAGTASLSAPNESISIDGCGTVLLNGTRASPSLARVDGSGDSELRIQVAQSLIGSGLIGLHLDNGGTLSPGKPDEPIGLIDMEYNNWEQRRNSGLVIDIGGAGVGEYDRILRADDVTLDGSLSVRLANGFVPSPQHEFVILTHAGRSGEFASVEGEPGSIVRWWVRYDANAVVLSASCVTDFDRDGETGLADLAQLLANYGRFGIGIQGDVDGDHVVTLNDLALLLRIFGGPCA